MSIWGSSVSASVNGEWRTRAFLHGGILKIIQGEENTRWNLPGCSQIYICIHDAKSQEEIKADDQIPLFKIKQPLIRKAVFYLAYCLHCEQIEQYKPQRQRATDLLEHVGI